MIRCRRCGGQLESTDSREIYKGFVMHLYCAWKQRRKDEEYANTVHQGGRLDTSVHASGDADGSGRTPGASQGETS